MAERISALEAKILEALIKFRQLTAGIYQAVRATGPRWVAVGINIQFHGVPGTTPRGARGEAASIRHLDGDFMIFRVNVFFHRFAPIKRAIYLGDGAAWVKARLRFSRPVALCREVPFCGAKPRPLPSPCWRHPRNRASPCP